MNTAMVSLGQLWLPIIISAVVVFIASSVLHMVLKYHNTDYMSLSNEDAVRAAINAGRAVPGQYIIPYCADPKELGTPEKVQKLTEGPVGIVVLRPTGPVKMGGFLGEWFIVRVCEYSVCEDHACEGAVAPASHEPCAGHAVRR